MRVRLTHEEDAPGPDRRTGLPPEQTAVATVPPDDDPRSARAPRRTLDGSGPFRKCTHEKGKRAKANPSHFAPLCGFPLVGPELA